MSRIPNTAEGLQLHCRYLVLFMHMHRYRYRIQYAYIEFAYGQCYAPVSDSRLCMNRNWKICSKKSSEFLTKIVPLISSETFYEGLSSSRRSLQSYRKNIQLMKHEISSLGLFWPSRIRIHYRGTDPIKLGSSLDHNTASYHVAEHSFL